MKGKLANGVGSQYSSHYLGTWCMYPALLPLMRTPRVSVVDRTEAPAGLNGLVRFAERRNLVSVRVPSHFKLSVLSAKKYRQNSGRVAAQKSEDLRKKIYFLLLCL